MFKNKNFIIFLMLTLFFLPQFSKDKFSIYLASKEQAKINIYNINTDAKTIKLESEPWIQDLDILVYDRKTHSFELTLTGWNRICKTILQHKSIFVVCVGKIPIYWGVALYGMQSAPYDGIVIKIPWVEMYYPEEPSEQKYQITIQCGFPDESYCNGWFDPRSDKRILETLRESGILKE